MTAHLVVTHGYTDGTTVDVCELHEPPNFSSAGASYSGVDRGAHEGDCAECSAPDAES